MPLLNIRIYGDPVLRKQAEPITEITDSIRHLAADMGETMYTARGVGLAANQVGELKRIVVVDVDQVENEGKSSAGKRKTNPERRNLVAYLNPEIIESGVEDGPQTEGCLSIPGLDGEVYRPLHIKVRYMDLEGRIHELTTGGLLARALQHEIDHLNGVMFVDRMEGEKRRLLAGQLSRLRQIAEENPLGVEPGKGIR